MSVLGDLADAVRRSFQAVFKVPGGGGGLGVGTETEIRHIPRRATSGIRVTEDTALTYSSVFACVRVLTETIAGFPWHVFRPDRGGGRVRETGSPVDVLLDKAPNPLMSAFTFREVLTAHTALWGNGYAEIEMDAINRPRALWPLLPDRMSVVRNRDTGEVLYQYTTQSGVTVLLPASRVLHVKGLGYDGLAGYSVVRLAAQSFGLGLAMQEFGSAFFGNGTWPSGVLQTDNHLSDEAFERLKRDWGESHGGPTNARHPAILESGVKWQPLGVPPEDAQFLESRKFQRTEVCAWFRVPPHMIGDLERATFSNIEQQSLDFARNAVVPWVRRWEQEVNLKLLGGARDARFSKMNMNALMRGDSVARKDFYASARQWGWLNVNEIRELEDLNPIGEEGDIYLVPVNMQPAERLTEPPPPAPPPPPPVPSEEGEEDGDSEEVETSPARAGHMREATVRLLSAASEQCWTRERKYANTKTRDPHYPQIMREWLYGSNHRTYCRRRFEPVVESIVQMVAGDCPREHVDQLTTEAVELHLARSLEQLQKTPDGAEHDQTAARVAAASLMSDVARLGALAA